MMMVISSNDLIALYLGLELLSLSSYVIAAFDRDNVRSTEAGLKYFVLGALSSGMLLYGASLVYGFTGSVSFPTIAATVQGNAGFGLIFGLVFVAAGIAFKISAVPFHMWTPDVYEGAPTPVTAFFAAAPKMAGMAMATRVFIDAFPGILGQWQQIIVFIAIASMALGSFAAIGQRNLKRLMAYSSIGNVGFALVGLATGTNEGIQGVVIYMAIYLAMTLGSFAVILSMRRGDRMFETIEDLSGLSRTHPLMAFCLAMMMFSLAGIPPLAGFFAKFAVFTAAINANLVTLAVIGVVTSVIGAYYYLRIVKVMYFDERGGGLRAHARGRAFRPRPVERLHRALRPFPGTADGRRGRCRAVTVLTCGWRPRQNPPDTGSSGAKRRNPRTTMPSPRPRPAIRGSSGSLQASSARGGGVMAGNGRRRRATFMQACCSSTHANPQPHHNSASWRGSRSTRLSNRSPESARRACH